MRPETAHIIQVLRSAIRVLGYTNRQIETKLGVSGGYLTRLFNGTMELRFEHIVDIARAIGLEPEEIFQLAYPQPHTPPTEAAQRLHTTFGPRPEPPAEVPTPAAGGEKPITGDMSLSALLELEMERTMRKVFTRLFHELGEEKAARK